MLFTVPKSSMEIRLLVVYQSSTFELYYIISIEMLHRISVETIKSKCCNNFACGKPITLFGQDHLRVSYISLQYPCPESEIPTSLVVRSLVKMATDYSLSDVGGLSKIKVSFSVSSQSIFKRLSQNL